MTIFKLKEFGGNCPVQASGIFLGYYFYFRSRGKSARIDFSNSEDDWWDDKQVADYLLYTTNEEYKASWLSERFCKMLILKGFLLFIFNYLILRKKIS